VYQASTILARRDSPWRSDMDGWTVKCTAPSDNFLVWAGKAHCYHYGFVGNLAARVMKERRFQDLFKAHGFPDPKVVAMAEGNAPASMAYLFQDAKDKGLFTPFAGTHPAVMVDWIAARKQY